MANEAHARIKINKLLEEAGWCFFDDENGPANLIILKQKQIKRIMYGLVIKQFMMKFY